MKLNPQQLKQLQEQISKGDQEAFSALYRLFFMRLFNFTKMYVHNRAAAEELVNDIMLKVWYRRGDLPAIVNLETYLFVAARNRSLNYLAQPSPFQITLEPESGALEIVNADDPERLLEWREIYQLLEQAVEELPDQCRTVFKLIKEEGLSYKQVAEILGVSPRTVETQLVRAMKKLYKVVGCHLDGPGPHGVKTAPGGLPTVDPGAHVGLLLLFFDFI